MMFVCLSQEDQQEMKLGPDPVGFGWLTKEFGPTMGSGFSVDQNQSG